jgi:hypothetical protein
MAAAHDAAAGALFSWLAGLPGAFVHPALCVRDFPATGRGVACDAPLARGELVLRVPASAVLTAPAALALLGPLIAAAGPAGPPLLRCLGEDDALAIAAALLLEAADASPPPRVRALPRAAALRGVAGAGGWAPAELALLRDGGAAAAAAARGAEAAAAGLLLRAAAAAAAAAGAPAGAALLAALGAGAGAWRWAVACAASRAFLHGGAAEALFCGAGAAAGLLPLALVPGADMFNHDAGGGGGGADSAWLACGGFEVRAARRAPAGGELLISYGDRPARDLLENYGFVPPAGGNAAEALALDAAPLALAACGGCACGDCAGGGGGARGGGAFAALLAALPPAGPAALRARRAALLGEATGLPPHAAEVELPMPRAGGGGAGGGAADALRVLRALCLAPGDAGAARGAAALEAPLSRGNETLAHAALAALLGEAVAGAHWGGAFAGAGGEGAAAVLLAGDGAPLLSAAAGAALLGQFEAAAEAAAGAAAAAAAAEGGGGGAAPAVTALAAAAAAAAGALAGLLRELLLAEADICGGLASAAELSAALAAAPAAAGGEGEGGAPWAAAEAALGDGGGGGGGGGADRAALAAAYRRVRAAGALAFAEHAAAMLRVAAGQGRGAPPSPAPAPAPAPSPQQQQQLLRFGGAAVCLEVQEPWCSLLLRGAKRVETRAYALPPALVGARVALLRAPPGGLAAGGLASGALVGWAVFGAPARYGSREAWAADAGAHGVVEGAPGAAAFCWEEGAEKWAWPVAAARAAEGPPLPVALSEALRWKRSVFLLPFAGSLAGRLAGTL